MLPRAYDLFGFPFLGFFFLRELGHRRCCRRKEPLKFLSTLTNNESKKLPVLLFVISISKYTTIKFMSSY